MVFEISAANGQISKGKRVQTFNDDGPHADNKWYCATVRECYDNNTAMLDYDDGDCSQEQACYIYILPPGHPGSTQKIAMGAQTQAGPPGFVGAVGQSVGVIDAPPVVVAETLPVQPTVVQPTIYQPPPSNMVVMAVIATAPGGHLMTLQGPDGNAMEVQVPPGVQLGQTFDFQVQAPDSGGAAAPQVVMGTPM